MSLLIIHFLVISLYLGSNLFIDLSPNFDTILAFGLKPTFGC